MSRNFTCPYCNHPTTITDPNFFSAWNKIIIAKSDKEDVGFYFEAITCPNVSCKKLWLRASLNKASYFSFDSSWHIDRKIQEWQLLPDSSSRVFPDYVPKSIREDYYEACKIRDLSPKASATLARRALQGMIRDFWKVTGKSLKDEVDSLQGKVDQTTWKGIDAIRSVGNIGAHMEKDINVIVDVEPREAKLLLDLIERLEKEWYEERKQREDHLSELEKLATNKQAQRKSKPTV